MTTRQRVLDAVTLVARLGLAAVWLVSGSIKAADLTQTRLAVRAYRLLPVSVADTVGLILPFLELALGLLLLVGLATRLTAVLSAVVLLVFIGGVASAAARGLSIDCGCFGGGGQVAAGQTAYTAEILRDTGFLVLAAVLVRWPWTPLSVDRFVLDRAASRA
ncbi:MauE/DoxX family redox-associated membrane protein [Nakamurella endophytica]|uniref:MauE/DoxX family redox-associated membrane protein n=1 Tax=Nakamurella endophytica TaxID=1748367 RepID=UPI001E324C07|nr:MauE/DoxX family redox-associated membrane protein [Nakamurella endophytica]